MSSTPTLHKSPWISKVNSFLYEIPFRTPLNCILFEHLPLCYARYHMTSTTIREDAEEAKESRPSKTYACKRSRKRQDEGGAAAKAGQPASQPAWAGPRAGRPPDPAGLPAGLGRVTGWPPASASRPPGRPRPSPGPGPGRFPRFHSYLHPVLYFDYK